MLSLNKALWHLIRTQCKLGLGLYCTIREPVISKNKMQIMHYRQAHSLSRRVMPLCSHSAAEGARPSGGGGGVRQRNRPLTENCTHDWKGLVNRMNNTCLSPCNYGFHYTTMHLSHAVTTPFSISVYVCTHRQSHTAAHTHGVRYRERETSSKQDIWQHLLFFFRNLLKEMYASQQTKCSKSSGLAFWAVREKTKL